MPGPCAVMGWGGVGGTPLTPHPHTYKTYLCLHKGLTEHDERTVAMIMEIREVLNGDSFDKELIMKKSLTFYTLCAVTIE